MAGGVNTRARIKTRHPGIYYRETSRGDRRYIVWYADHEGKGRFVTLPARSTERDAKERQAELRGKAARGEKLVSTKVLFSDLADEWVERVRNDPDKTERTHVMYSNAVRIHLKPHFGRRLVRDVDVDSVAELVMKMKRSGYAAWTIRSTLTPLSRIMALAMRRGLVASNPVTALDKDERPKGEGRKMRILSTQEIAGMLKHSPDKYRPVLATLVFTGMRISECLFLRWENVDFDRGIIRVVESKTPSGRREIAMMPALGKMLRQHKLASPFSRDFDYVFASTSGGPIGRRNLAGRGLLPALKAIGSDPCRLHDLRHTYASILVGQGMDVSYVSHQLGHSSPAITLGVYAKLFDPERRTDEARGKLEQAFGVLL